MGFQVILHKPENGLEKIDSIVIDEKPTEEWAERMRSLYGADRYEIIEVHGEE